jgi:hypothetical protein
MRLEISFRFSAWDGGRTPVSDWIKGMKQREDDAKQCGQVDDSLRLHCVSVIKAKAPMLWSSITEQVEADCKELNQTFKDDIRRCCRFDRRSPNEFTLVGNTSPQKGLRLELIPDALGVSHNLFADGARQGSTELLKFGVDKADEIYLSGLGGRLNDPGRISELLIRKVIEE